MYATTTAIYTVLKDAGLKVFTEERGNISEAWLGFDLDNGSSYKIRFISTSEKNDVAVRVVCLVKITQEKRPQIIGILNELNTKYRYIKFCCDKDNDINVEYDFPIECTNPAECALELVIRFSRVIKEAYPMLMRAMWS